MNKRLIFPIILLLTVGLTFFASVFAWITLSEQARVNEFIVSVENFAIEYNLEVSKNGSGYEQILTHDDWLLKVENTVPSDSFAFRLTVINRSNVSLPMTIKIAGFESYPDDDDYADYDMLDIFILKDGIVTIDGENNILTPNDDEVVTKHDQELNIYRLSNLINQNGSLILVGSKPMVQDQQLVVEFTIVYDEETEEYGYQNRIITLKAIEIYAN